MIIDTSSWHYRTMVWAYGRRYFFKRTYTDVYMTEERKPVALCPYVDRLILAIVFSPVIAFWRLFTDNGKIVVLITSIGLLYGSAFSLALGWIGFLVGIAVVWAFVGTIKLLDYWSRNHPSKPKEPKAEKPKKQKEKKPKGPPNIFMEWLRAKHRKICPYLQFTDEKEALVSL